MRGGQKWVHLPRIVTNYTMHEMSKTARHQDGFAREILRLQQRGFPGMTDAQIARLKHRQYRRMQWHMPLDEVLWGKAWFKLVRQRHFQRFHGNPGVRVPVLSRILDLIPGPSLDSTNGARTHGPGSNGDGTGSLNP